MMGVALSYTRCFIHVDKLIALLCFALVLFISGCSKPTNDEESTEQMTNACLNGSASACSEGALRLVAERRDSDFELLYPNFTKTCNEIDTQGCHALAIIYSAGIGVIKDKKLAIELFHRACNSGHGEACFDEAHALGEAAGDEDISSAPWRPLLRSCARAHFSGCIVLSKKIFVDFPTEAMKNTSQYLHKMACSLGRSVGCFNYALAHDKADNDEFGRETSLSFYGKACEGGIIPACTNQGVLLLSKMDNEESKSRGITLLERGCEENNSFACFNLALSHNKNSNRSRNISLANKYFEKGCKLGNAESCTNLGNHFLLGHGGE